MVSPEVTVPCEAVATAAHPARVAAPGPDAKDPHVQGARSGITGSSRAIPSFSTSARDEAPTSTQSWSTPTTVVSARCWREKWPLAMATTPGTARAAVWIWTLVASRNWSASGCWSVVPDRCRRR